MYLFRKTAFTHISTLSFNYTQTKMITLSRPPANMNSIGEVCKGLREQTPSSFTGNLWATADSDDLVLG